MVAHATFTTIYIIVIEVSRMHFLLCAIYQNQKGVWLVCLFFLTSFNITAKFLINRCILNSSCTNFTKRSNTLKEFVSKLPTNCLAILWCWYLKG